MGDFKLGPWPNRAHRLLRLRQREVIPVRDDHATSLQEAVDEIDVTGRLPLSQCLSEIQRALCPAGTL